MAEAQALANAGSVAPSLPAMTDVTGASHGASAGTLPDAAPAVAAQHRLSLLERIGRSAFDPTDSEDLRMRKTLLIFANGLMILAANVWLAIYWIMGLKLPTTIPLMYVAFSAIILAVFLKTRNFDFFRGAQLSLFLFAPFVIQWTIGSFVNSSGIVLLALLAPMGAMVVYGARESIPWFVAYVVLTVVSGVFDFFLASGEMSGVPMRTVAVFFVLNFTILSSIMYVLLRYFVQQKDVFQAELSHQHELVREEQKKSEQLLNTILPPHIADRLKQGDTVAQGCPDVTVMFADIVNFTALAEKGYPKQVVNILNTVFTRFDELAKAHGVDKIKTIGDAYMVAGGLPRDGKEDEHEYVDAVADMALEILELARTDETMKRHDIKFHVGIATGPVIAGVIGATRFSYDLWGDTVNVASRITAEAPANDILVDTTTQRRLGTRYQFGSPQYLTFKGKGQMTVYQMTGKRDGGASD
jgi:adenylate cyclase